MSQVFGFTFNIFWYLQQKFTLFLFDMKKRKTISFRWKKAIQILVLYVYSNHIPKEYRLNMNIVRSFVHEYSDNINHDTMKHVPYDLF